MKKTCPNCKKEKDKEKEFYRNRTSYDGRQSWCIVCQNSRKRSPLPSGYWRESDLRKKFGITLKDYEELLENQGGVCAICGNGEQAVHPATNQVQNLAVDHCHKTDEVRGLLCAKCNHGLGNFQEDPDRLQKAKEYLLNYNSHISEPE